MPLVILQPCGNQDARDHYRDTIENSVTIDEVREFLTDEQQARLNEIYPDGKLKIWGVTPGLNGQNAKKWERMSAGDVTLLAQKKQIFASAVTTYKIHNKPLAAKLWNYDNKGQTWEYVYFLDEVEDQSIPYITLNRAVGYKDTNVIQGFTVLSEEKSEALLEAFDLESEIYYPSTEISEVISEIENEESLDTETKGSGRKEQRKLRELHLKNRKTGTCSICGSELPSNLLVAAHIKKRSKCTLDEKKDLANVATPMCVLGCDALFEKGYIGVNEGKVASIKPAQTNHAKSHVSILDGESCRDWTEENQKYYEWHWNHHSTSL